MPSIYDDVKGLIRPFKGHMISAVAQRGENVLFEGVLEAVDEHGETVGPNEAQGRHIFPLGSGSKIITAVALLKLLRRHPNVDLDDPVSDYGLGFQGAERVSIRSLITHTSGIPQCNDLSLGPASEPLQDKVSALSVIESFVSSALERNDDARYCYSNLNYILLARVMETISGGKEYHDIVKDEVFQPYRMDHSYASRSEVEGRDESEIMVEPFIEFGVDDFQKIPSPVQYLEDTALLPAFGIYSCWQDMKSFFSQLFSTEGPGEELATLGALDFFASNQADLMLWDNRYGAGMRPWTGPALKFGDMSQYAQTDQLLGRKRSMDVLYHAGFVRGYECSFVICPTEKWFVLSFSNATSLGDVADDVRYVLMAHLSGRPIDFDKFQRSRHALREDRLQAVENLLAKFSNWSLEPSSDVDMSNFEGRYVAENGLPSITVFKRREAYSIFMETISTSWSDDHDGQGLRIRFSGDALTICPETAADFILYLGNDFLSKACLQMEIERESGRITGLIRRFGGSSGEDNSNGGDSNSDGSVPIRYRRTR